MAHQVDRILEDLDKTMANLRQAMKSVPARRQAFKANHDRMARAVARLTVAVTDSKAAMDGKSRRRKR